MDMWMRRGPEAPHLLFFLFNGEESIAPLWQERGYLSVMELSQREAALGPWHPSLSWSGAPGPGYKGL